ncbi:hypothetical protein HDU93_008581 [Gonapodya sp. JEL0774]|nr:hypothetical protein HDU93_008581 [Gonapodya sp. JEL0774]
METLYISLLGIALWGINMFLLSTVLRKKSMLEPDVFTRKQIAYSRKILMADIRRSKDGEFFSVSVNADGMYLRAPNIVYKCTINDLLVTATSGAIQKYLQEKKALRDRELVYMIPTSVRKENDNSMSNEVSSWMVPIPATTEDPFQRLDTVAQRFRIYKKSDEPYIGYHIGQWALLFPWIWPTV